MTLVRATHDLDLNLFCINLSLCFLCIIYFAGDDFGTLKHKKKSNCCHWTDARIVTFVCLMQLNLHMGLAMVCPITCKLPTRNWILVVAMVLGCVGRSLCSCDAGLYGVGCFPCPANHYCLGGSNGEQECPAGTVTWYNGSSTIEECQCIAGKILKSTPFYQHVDHVVLHDLFFPDDSFGYGSWISTKQRYVPRSKSRFCTAIIPMAPCCVSVLLMYLAYCAIRV